jgi:arylsulfatase A-like enzyme
LIVLTAFAGLFLNTTTVQAAEKPNVVFITIDDLRAVDHYDPAVKTPNMDRLAHWGMRFERAYVQGTYCNPSRSSFLTGRRPNRLGVESNRKQLSELRPELTTLPEAFRKAGYHTMKIGKIFHKGGEPEAWDQTASYGPTKAGRQREMHDLSDGRLRWCKWSAVDCGDLDLPDGRMAKRAGEFLRAEHEEPFFLALGFQKPHDPYVAPKKYFEMYPLDELKLHQTPEDVSPTRQIGGGLAEVFNDFSERDKRELLRAYYAGATYMDAQLGRVLEALKEADRLENTIVMVLSDHGYHLNERGWWNKTTLYEYTVRSPLIAYAPGMSAEKHQTDAMVEFLDIYPTLLDLAGLEKPHAMDGESFAPILDNATLPGKDTAFGVRHRGNWIGRTVRTDRWRYIELRRRDSGKIFARELYDHRQDPGEFHNLADQPQHSDVVSRLHALLEWRRQRDARNGDTAAN